MKVLKVTDIANSLELTITHEFELNLKENKIQTEKKKIQTEREHILRLYLKKKQWKINAIYIRNKSFSLLKVNQYF